MIIHPTEYFFTKNSYQNTIILGCVSGALALVIAITITILAVKRKQRIDEENAVAREDLNPVYGVYYCPVRAGGRGGRTQHCQGQQQQLWQCWIT